MYKMKETNYEAGVKVFSNGSECNQIYIIASGHIEMNIEHQGSIYCVEEIGKGSIIGQFSVIN